MKVEIQLRTYGGTFVGDLTGPELEAFTKIIAKLAKTNEQYLPNNAESSAGVEHPNAGEYVYVDDGSPAVRPDVRIEVVSEKVTMKKDTYDTILKRSKASE